MKIQMIELFTPEKAHGKALTVTVTGHDMDRLIERTDGTLELQLALKEVTHKSFPLIARTIIRSAKQSKINSLVIPIDDLITRAPDYGVEKATEVFVTNLLLAEYSYDIFITDTTKNFHITNCVLTTSRKGMLQAALKKGITKGILANEARTLVNTPASHMSPRHFNEYVKQSVKGIAGVTYKSFNKKELAKMGAGAILAVGGGSIHEPCLIVLEYKHGKKSEAPIALVGKGVTFDTGGINLKTGEGMYQMHMDMGGAAAVLHSFLYAVGQKVQKNIIAVLPVVENAISGTSYRVNDIIHTLSGKTVEVLNTDAEGRLILADAMAYAAKYKPDHMITVATLTGAAIVALGQRMNALFASDEKLGKSLYDAAWLSHDYAWQMPLWSEYEKDVQGNVSDLTNIPMKNSRAGGTITAATFLHQFAKPYRFGHIDCAPRMTATEDDKLAFGATASPVLMLMEYLES